ncbi:DNA excision repair protein ERCC-5 homolog isoform X1 [Ostrinia nubilalis]|uniref:DNA excision repair protein ERCC-5 homolog isoform X1 n=2 Tax=Ostrinia nubilalis TaxID=29057 RepID=UPI00308267AC
MGVTGLWRLIEPTGKPVPVETLENKVLAVDISIWLHQMVKGYQDAKGAPLANAHLMGLFQRLCKLLYFRIKPVFVFDGGFPDLKRETIAKRQYNKAKYNSESERIKRELALLLSKKTAISSLLGKEISPKKGSSSNTTNNDDLFKLPALPENKEESESESEDESSSSSSIIDLHSVDIESNTFKTLPAKEKYDLLIELKETRKMNSWGRLHELPKNSDNFSDFQMQRLLKRRKVQECLEETEKEMGDGGMSLNELESLLNEEGIDTKIEELPTRRIASNVNTRFLLINNVKQALLDAKKRQENKNNPGPSAAKEEIITIEEKPPVEDESEEDLEKAIKMSLEFGNEDKNNPGSSTTKEESIVIDKNPPVKDELEEDLEKAIKMSLECADDQNTSNYTSKTDDSWTSVLSDNDYSQTDSEEEDGMEQPDMSSAKAYIMQYSDFTNKAIDEIITVKKKTKKPKTMGVDKILEEINNEKSIIVDNVDVSSDDSGSVEITSDKVSDKDVELSYKELENKETDVDLTQASVVFVENPVQDIITLDTSAEDNALDAENVVKDSGKNHCDKINLDKLGTINTANKQLSIPIGIESESSDEEFEDVPEIESKSTKPGIELTLNMEQTCEDDDIFADVFSDKKSSSNIVDIDHVLPPIKNNIDKVESVVNPIKSDFDKSLKSSPKEHASASLSTNLTQTAEKEDSIQKNNKDHTTSQKKDSLSITNTVPKSTIEKTTPSDIHENKSPKFLAEGVTKANTTKVDAPPPKEISIEKLNDMAKEVENEQQQLEQEKGRLDRVGRNITEQMTKEAQELLQIFGIPYIVAPMEAEAQCAFLESIKLTDGTITDDSDIWLFGGKTVYKNFFNQKKLVLQFLSERIEKSYNLTREQLILLALLVGSDYTTGIDGVGPVTALEILASFPFNRKQFLNETSKQGKYQQVVTGLQEFKNWVRAGKRTDNTSLKKKLRNISLNDDFPSVRVVQAYFDPNVEKSEDKFTWGELDITILRDYTKAKFGWSQNKVDEILKPVLKRQMERKSQKTVRDYFKRTVEFQSLEHQMSKRVKAAVQKMDPQKPVGELLPVDEEQPSTSSKPPRKRKTNTEKGTAKAKPIPTGPGPVKRNKKDSECKDLNVRVVAHVDEATPGIDIIIPKTDRYQEIIPQREKDKESLLQNRMKAIEIFRKTNIDRKRKAFKKKPLLPKEKADLSESSDGD